MKKMFTKVLGTALLAVLMSGFTANAQTTLASAEPMNKKDAASTEIAPVTVVKAEAKKDDPIDTSWHPQRRVWGYAFGDFSYVGHAPVITSSLGKENNYANVATGRNTFQFRRIYLGYDYEITKKFKAEFLLASEPTENTGLVSGTSVVNGDVTADNKMSFYIKNINLRARDVWNGTDFVIGEMSTPGFALNEPGTNAPTSLSESTWGYRSIERTITDFHKNNSFDVGAALQGTFDPKTKNFGYVLMVGNNTQASVVNIFNSANPLSPTNPNPNGFFKIFYGDLWGKFLDKKLYIDIYADNAQTSSTIANSGVSSGSIGPLEHSMYKAFVAYTVPKFTFGVEAYTQKLNNALIDNTTKTANDATVNAISLFAKGMLAKDWNWFARFDSYNPDTKFDGSHSYSAVSGGAYSSFDPTVKEQFYTAGLDYNPTKNVHFMPNIWLTRYSSEYDKTITSYVPDNHTLVYRFTFFYTFGK